MESPSEVLEKQIKAFQEIYDALEPETKEEEDFKEGLFHRIEQFKATVVSLKAQADARCDATDPGNYAFHIGIYSREGHASVNVYWQKHVTEKPNWVEELGDSIKQSLKDILVKPEKEWPYGKDEFYGHGGVFEGSDY